MPYRLHSLLCMLLLLLPFLSVQQASAQRVWLEPLGATVGKVDTTKGYCEWTLGEIPPDQEYSSSWRLHNDSDTAVVLERIYWSEPNFAPYFSKEQPQLPVTLVPGATLEFEIRCLRTLRQGAFQKVNVLRFTAPQPSLGIRSVGSYLPPPSWDAPLDSPPPPQAVPVPDGSKH